MGNEKDFDYPGDDHHNIRDYTSPPPPPPNEEEE